MSKQKVYSNFNHNRTVKNSEYEKFSLIVHRQPTAHTHTPDFGFHYLFFSKTTYHVPFLPKALWVNQLFCPSSSDFLDLKPRLLTRNAAKKNKNKNKQQPMFNRRCVSTNCYFFFFFTVFEVNTKMAMGQQDYLYT